MASAATTISTLAWAAFFVYWWLASKGASAAVEDERGWKRHAHLLLFAGAFILAISPLLSVGVATFAAPTAGLATQLAGLAFAVWARIALGRHWSGTVTIKEGHELIQHGPYAIVRHPIYTGLLVAFLGNAFVVADLRGWIALLFATLAIVIKVPREEAFMESAFGEEWLRYRARVRAIVPFVF